MKNILCWLVFSMFCLNVFSEEISGKVLNVGFSGIVIKDQKNVEMKLLSQRKMTYTPDDWRPQIGDKVKISFFEKAARNGTMQLVIESIDLIEYGKNNKPLESPVIGTVHNPGRKAIDIKVNNRVIKFEKNRNTVFVPTGFIPSKGQKVKVEFTPTPSKFSRFDKNRMINVIDKIELIN